MKLGYLPGLDGFRGAAVVAVLVFHGGFGWAQGGFLGVTAFFVLSGFLITSLLLLERQATGRISLRAFWARRARRLVPAALLTMALVVAYVAVVGAGSSDVVGDGLAAAAWVANWRFLFEGQSYADLFADPSPFQHMWSLAIEEQFYLLLPLVVVGLAARRRVVFAAVVAAGAAASTAAVFAFGASDRAYYGTDARVAEPLVGVLLALALIGPMGLRTVRRRWGLVLLDVAAAGGVAGLAALVYWADERAQWVYRGGFLAAALASAAVVAATSQSRTLTARALSLPPLVVVGRLSYGIYLFHWPVFLWLDESSFLLQCAATLALAGASYLLVERPVRLSRLPRRVGPVAWANASVGLLAGLVLVAGVAPAPTSSFLMAEDDELVAPPLPDEGLDREVTTTTSEAASTTSSTESATGTTGPAKAKGKGTTAPKTTPTSSRPPAEVTLGGTPGPVTSPPPPPPSTTPSPDGEPPSPPRLRVAVVGDSMAVDLGEGLEAWAKEQGDVVVYTLAMPSCPFSRGGIRRIFEDDDYPVRGACAWWGDDDSQRWRNLVAFEPDVIVMHDGLNEVWDRKRDEWGGFYREPGDPWYDSWLVDEYEAAVDRFSSLGATPLFLNAPCADWNKVVDGRYADRGPYRIDHLNQITAPVSARRWSADLNRHICPDGRFTTTVDGVENARPDGYHLSPAAAKAVVTQWLGPMLLQAAPPPETAP